MREEENRENVVDVQSESPLWQVILCLRIKCAENRQQLKQL